MIEISGKRSGTTSTHGDAAYGITELVRSGRIAMVRSGATETGRTSDRSTPRAQRGSRLRDYRFR